MQRRREREGGECKLMEKRHEDYYRLISSHDDDRKLEGERVREEGEMEGGELEERRNVSPAAAAAASLPSLDLTLSVRPSRRPRDE